MDLKLALHLAGDVHGSSFDRHCYDLKKKSDLRMNIESKKQKVIQMEQLITYLSILENVQAPLSVARNEVINLRQAIKSMVIVQSHIILNPHINAFQEEQEKELEAALTKKFKKLDGPFFQVLEVALNTLHVQRQAYQGGTFVGNHVHKLLKVYTYIPLYLKRYC